MIEKDETEQGKRKSLNFGHTVGHGIEHLSGYKIKHGIAVALGMVCETFLSLEMGIVSRETFREVLLIVKTFNLPLTHAYFSNKKSIEKIYDTMLFDKKNKQQSVQMCVLKKVGCVFNYKNNYTVTLEKDFFLAKVPLLNKTIEKTISF